MSRPSAPASRARSTARCWPACTARRRSACKSTGVFTNTVPTDAYRGAGRPEACYVLERLADEAARELGIDRAEIRRRNLVPAEAMPYKTPIGPTYDCGDFPEGLCARCWRLPTTRALRTAGHGRRTRSCAASASPATSNPPASRRRGSPAALGARVGFFEAAQIRVQPDGSVQALLGTHNHGQGHATTFAQIISSRLGVPMASDRDRRRRHRSGAVWHRHVRLALHRGRRLGARPRRDEDHREGQADRRASARGFRRRHRIRRRRFSPSPAPTGA